MKASANKTDRKSTLTPKWLRKDKRYAVYARDSFRCVYCCSQVHVGANPRDPHAATVDHVTPRALGGTNSDANLVTCCALCNSRKQDATKREWGKRARQHNITEDTRTMWARVRRQTKTNLKPYRARVQAWFRASNVSY